MSESQDPILIENREGLNVVTTLEEARDKIALLVADNRHLRKSVMSHKDELNRVYDALLIIKVAMGNGIDIVFQERKNR